jgi:hypothetical protein
VLCTILTDIAQALSSGRSVMIGIDKGASLQLHAFNTPGDPHALLIAKGLYEKALEQAQANFPPSVGELH